ncbi:TRAP transporter large permease [Mesorhizobium sp.]|uniref:TRAP transporter large permease n=1 Tax=Mesorhizobium sp. TaxID=1871066 RepID=UPI000FE6D408|nr:TRAP transporter large permease [Mesorhizobium sp.]RWI88935.1 MAG: TRAP transporter large permease [Mesorhizobium sp.]
MAFLIVIVFFVLLFGGVPVAFALGITGMAGLYFSPGGSDLLAILPQEVFRSLSNFPMLTIPLFILAGTIMAQGGIGKRLTDFAEATVGRGKGGLGVSVIVSTMFFHGISGSTTADTAAITRVALPSLVKQGYPVTFATALIAASGATATLIPPTIDLIIIGVVANISIAGLFAAGVVPAIINGIALIAYVLYVSVKRNYGNMTRTSLRGMYRALIKALPALAMIAIILGGILGGVFTPTEASAVAVAYALFVSIFVYRDLKLSQIPDIIRSTLELTGMVLLLIGTGAILSYSMSFNGVPNQIADGLQELASNKFVFLLLVQLIFFIVGTIMDATPALLVLMPILTPIAVDYGVEPIHFGILVEANVALHMAVPPAGLALYAACAVSRVPIETVVRPLLPMIVLLTATMLIITYFEPFSMWLPQLLHLVD